MYKQLLSKIKPLLKSLFAIGLVLTLALGNADGLWQPAAEDASGADLLELRRAVTHRRAALTPRRPGVTTRAAALAAAFGFPFLLPFFGFGGGFGGLSRF